MSLKIYVDDCANARQLVVLLRAAGHQVVVPADVGLSGQDDVKHLAYATANRLTLLTKDPDDFYELHQSSDQHAGILGIYQDNDASRDMTHADIVKAIANLVAAGMPVANNFHTLNAWRY